MVKPKVLVGKPKYKLNDCLNANTISIFVQSPVRRQTTNCQNYVLFSFFHFSYKKISNSDYLSTDFLKTNRALNKLCCPNHDNRHMQLLFTSHPMPHSKTNICIWETDFLIQRLKRYKLHENQNFKKPHFRKI